MLDEKLEAYASETREDVKQTLRELCVIPAPSHHEEKRAAYVYDWMKRSGAENVTVDGALNVIWPMNVTEDNDISVIMAHTDVVFPDTEALPLTEDEKYFYCPGVSDDTSQLCVLLYAAKYFSDSGRRPKDGVLIVANSCEEGLGNLKGSRAIVDTYGKRIKRFITFDGSVGSLCTTAVGSHRYRVTVRTEGGHSFGSFGNRNAIAYLSSMISTLYDVKVPKKEGTKTTYNVGEIHGGTSVNTIAQEASMLFEYRSDDRECLAQMKNIFDSVVEAYRAMGIGVDVELLGERPCNGTPDPEEWQELKDMVCASALEINGRTPKEGSGSTDANYPLSKDIPAVCTGASRSSGCHTREEKVEIESLYDGMRYALSLLNNFFEE